MSDCLSSAKYSNNCHPAFLIHFNSFGIVTVSDHYRVDCAQKFWTQPSRTANDTRSRSLGRINIKKKIFRTSDEREARAKRHILHSARNNTLSGRESQKKRRQIIDLIFLFFLPCEISFRYHLISYLRHSLNYTFSTLVRR